MRTPKPFFKIMGAVALMVLTWVASDLYHTAIKSQNLSALGQLGADTSRALEAYYAANNTYPRTLQELPVSFGDGATKDDLKNATYLTEGSLAVVILERPNGPSLLLVFKKGKAEGNTKYIGV